MSTPFDRTIARTTAVVLAAAATLATLGGLDSLARVDHSSQLVQSAAAGARG